MSAFLFVLFIVSLVSGLISLLTALSSFAMSKASHETEVSQSPRILFHITSAIFVGALAVILTSLLLDKILLFNRPTALIVGALVAGAILKNSAFFTEVAGNTAKVAVPLFGGTIGDKGIVLYRIFLSGFKWKFPWESFGKDSVIDLEKDTVITKTIEVEFEDSVGKLTWVATIQPNKNRIQQLLNIGLNSEERKEVLGSVFTSLFNSLIGVACKREKIDDIMSNRKKIVQEITDPSKKSTNGLEEKEMMYGVSLNSFVISDIDYTSEDRRKAKEQMAVASIFMDTVAMILDRKGYTPEQIKNIGKDGGVTEKEYAEAVRLAKILSDEVNAWDINISGVENLQNLHLPPGIQNMFSRGKKSNPKKNRGE